MLKALAWSYLIWVAIGCLGFLVGEMARVVVSLNG